MGGFADDVGSGSGGRFGGCEKAAVSPLGTRHGDMVPVRFEAKDNWGVVGGERQIPLGHFEYLSVAFVHLFYLRLLCLA